MSTSAHLEFKHNIDSYIIEIARGNVPGAELFGAFGEVISVGALTNWMVWPGPTQYQPYIHAGAAMSIISSSASDAAAGTGIQQVEIHYIDTNGDAGHVLVELNGTTPVSTGITARFIQCVHANRVGSGKIAAGNITITSGGVVYSYIMTGKTRCTSSARVVPKGKTLFITEAVGGSSSGTAAADATIAISGTELDTHRYVLDGIYIPYNQVALQDSAVTLSSRTPFVAHAGSIVAMFCTVDKASTITASWAGWIENE